MRNFFRSMTSCLISSLTCTLSLESSPSESVQNDDDEPKLRLKIYQILFGTKRKEHLTVVEQIMGYEKDKQDRLIFSLVNTMGQGFKDAKLVIETSRFAAGSPFPDDGKPDLKEAVSRTLENTAFFADLALHFPNTVAKLYKRDNDLKTWVNWAIRFSNTSGFYDEKATKLMYLVGQELGLVERDPAYVNPYSASHPFGLDPAAMDLLEKQRLQKIEKEKKAKREAKRMKQKGPKLQAGPRSEL